jgi:hypothetical protein
MRDFSMPWICSSNFSSEVLTGATNSPMATWRLSRSVFAAVSAAACWASSVLRASSRKDWLFFARASAEITLKASAKLSRAASKVAWRSANSAWSFSNSVCRVAQRTASADSLARKAASSTSPDASRACASFSRPPKTTATSPQPTSNPTSSAMPVSMPRSIPIRRKCGEYHPGMAQGMSLEPIH